MIKLLEKVAIATFEVNYILQLVTAMVEEVVLQNKIKFFALSVNYL
ncbi:MAG: hypothetical protein ACRC80_14690 [Waterburya sp.]